MVANIPLYLDKACENPAVVAFRNDPCGRFKALPKGFVFSDLEFSFDGTNPLFANPEDLASYLDDYVAFKSTTSTDTERLSVKPMLSPYYPAITNLEPTGGDPNMVTEGFGSPVPNGINAYSEVYTLTDGGDCMYKNLAKLKGRPLRVFKIDQNNVMYGWIDSKGQIRGYKAYVTVYERPNTGTTTAANMLLITYSVDYENERDNEIPLALGRELMTLRSISVYADPTLSDVNGFRIVNSCSGQSITQGNATLSAAFVANPSVITKDGLQLDDDYALVYVGEAAGDYFQINGDVSGTPTPVAPTGVALIENLFSGSGEDIEEFKYLLGNTTPTRLTPTTRR